MYFNRSYVETKLLSKVEDEILYVDDSDTDPYRSRIESFFRNVSSRIVKYSNSIPEIKRKQDLRFLIEKYEEACELSWTSNFGVDYFKSRLSIELEKLNVDVEVRDLIGSLSHKHNMSVLPNRELKKIATRYEKNESLLNLVTSSSFQNLRTGRECLCEIEAVSVSCAEDLRKYIQRWEFMSEEDERLGATSFADDPKIPLGFFVALLRNSAKTNVNSSNDDVKHLATTMQEIVKISRRTKQVRSGRDQIRLVVPEEEETNPRFVYVRTRVRSSEGWKGYLWNRAAVIKSSSSSSTLDVSLFKTDFSLKRTWPETEMLRIRKDSEDLSLNSNVWDILRDLKLMLTAKETIHLSYVKTGFYLKRVAMSLFSRDERVFNLYKKDILDLLEDPSFLSRELRIATLRKDMYSRFEPPYDAGVTYIRKEAHTVSRTGIVGETFVGVGVSSGRRGTASGVACVCKSLSEASRLQKGQILVVSHTGPSWTPIFSLVSAVVMDTGGPLSHGATVAREYGVPAVTVANATSLIKSGQKLVVDGDEGVVTLV